LTQALSQLTVTKRNGSETKKSECVAASTLAQSQAVPALSFLEFCVEDDEVDIENERLDTSIAHGGGGLEEEDTVSALLSLVR